MKTRILKLPKVYLLPLISNSKTCSKSDICICWSFEILFTAMKWSQINIYRK